MSGDGDLRGGEMESEILNDSDRSEDISLQTQQRKSSREWHSDGRLTTSASSHGNECYTHGGTAGVDDDDDLVVTLASMEEGKERSGT
ncbi:hypothetical protein BHE74_00047182 [Ensete ventricosum]|nr:hypothetical protein GW17_00050580 [Ensete ventricosum]RWW46872.1 hypothetical protein BHE74_00047182 [Ensete ventricosum]